MADIEIHIDVECSKCGSDLDATGIAPGWRTSSTPKFRVEPCETCMESAGSDGYTEGYEKCQQEAEAAMEESGD